jgi:hypothetical protein
VRPAAAAEASTAFAITKAALLDEGTVSEAARLCQYSVTTAAHLAEIGVQGERWGENVAVTVVAAVVEEVVEVVVVEVVVEEEEERLSDVRVKGVRVVPGVPGALAVRALSYPLKKGLVREARTLYGTSSRTT